MNPILDEILSASIPSELLDGHHPDPAVHSVVRTGQRIQQLQAKLLEKTLAQSDTHVAARIALLSFYSQRQWRNSKWTDRYASHCEWLIVHHPRGFLSFIHTYHLNDDNFKHLRTCWLRQVQKHPRDVFVLDNAAHFCYLNDPNTSERLWIRASDEDVSAYWSYNLARLYLSKLSHDVSRKNKKLLLKALTFCSAMVVRFSAHPDVGLVNARSIQELLSEYAELALNYSRHDEAMKCAEQIMDLKEFYCDEVIYCEPISIFGRVSLLEGRVEQARRAMQQLIDEKELNLALCYGPVAKLANALLNAAQFDAVIRFVKSYVHDSDVTLRHKSITLQNPAILKKRKRQLEIWLKRSEKGKFSELAI